MSMPSDFLRIHSQPALHHPAIVAAFQGWPDAGEVASAALRYLIRTLGAVRFAEIVPEDFYIFTEVRPHAIQVRPGQRTLRWPSNEFFFWRNPAAGRDLILFLGREPNLKWSTYTGTLLDLAESQGSSLLVTLGGTYDTVSHHGDAVVTGIATTPRLRQILEGMAVGFSDYQGPGSVHSAVLQTAKRRGVPGASLWGHAPHYIQSVPNVKLCHALIERLSALIEVRVDLDELEAASRAMERRVDEALAENAELREYVRQLEAGIIPEAGEEDDDNGPDDPGRPGANASAEVPNPESVLAELEEFLRQTKRSPDEPESD
ncbi:MAG: PAC2 family protein [Chloroflexi bacterium]|nr:PAC2 family protein [Chloroflexota bacterium]